MKLPLHPIRLLQFKLPLYPKRLHEQKNAASTVFHDSIQLVIEPIEQFVKDKDQLLKDELSNRNKEITSKKYTEISHMKKNIR